MMRCSVILERISLGNFKRYSSFEMTFESGLCGILGRNGSGKSTIFEAVFFALYGESQGKKELLKTSNSEGSLKVVLEFSMEAKSYSVTREFRGKALTAYAALHENGEAVASGAKEVTAAIVKLLGMSKEAFLHTVFASQKELTALSSMKNDERKTMMRRLLGLEKIDAIEKMIREKLTDLNRDIKAGSAYLLEAEALAALQQEKVQKTQTLDAKAEVLKALHVKAETLQKAYEASKAAVSAQQNAKEARAKKTQTRQQLSLSLEAQEKQLRALDEELSALHAKAKEYETSLPLKAQFAELEKSIATQEALKAAYLKKEGLEREQTQLRLEFTSRREEVANLSREIAPMAALKTQLAAQQNALEAAKKVLGESEQKVVTCKGNITANRSKIADVQRKVQSITALGRESACPVCTRPLLEQYDTVIATLQSEISEVYEKQIAALEAELGALTQEQAQRLQAHKEAQEALLSIDKTLSLLQSKERDLAAAQKRFTEVETRGLANKAALAELGSITYDENAHNALKTTLQQLKPQLDALLGLEALIATIPAKTEARERLKNDMATTKTAFDAAAQTLAADTYDEALHVKAIEQSSADEKAREAHNAVLQNETLAHNNLLRDIEAIDKELLRDAGARNALQEKVNERNDYEKLKAVMAEFKTHINARVAPRIGEVASEMFVRITRGRYQHIEVSPEFDFFIYDNNERYPIERFSGGEIDLANLVLRIAISKTLGELSGGGNIGFLAFDEVFGSQDEERRIQIMEAFHTISESYRQIFLISHETEIKEMFERVVEL